MTKRTRPHMVTTALLAALVCSACSGSSHLFHMAELRYPASMSGYLYGPGDRLLSKDDLEVVADLKEKVRVWGIFWTKTEMNGESAEAELTEAINRAIEKSGGEAVMNLQFTSDACGISLTPVLSMLPFWPGCTVVGATGRIVRRAPHPPAAPTSEEAPAGN